MADSLSDLVALSRDLKKMGDGALRKELKSVDRQAAQRIATKARSLADAQGRQMARAGRTIKPLSGSISVGSDAGSDSWALAAMFGTYQNKQRQTRRGPRVGYRQFKPVKKGGYTVYPAIEAERAAVTQMYADGIDKAIGSNLR